MNKIRHLAYLLLLLFAFTSCTKVQKEYYEDGSIKSEIETKKDKKNGKAVWYHQNGNKQIETQYIDDKIDGFFSRWFFNGGIQTTEHYTNGILNGEKKEWNETGSLVLISNYKNGKLNGKFQVFYPDGEIQIEGEYLDDNYNNTWKYFNESGLEVGEGIFEKGTGIQKEFDKLGKITKITNYKNNTKNGLEFIFNAKGDTINKITYKDGRIIQ